MTNRVQYICSKEGIDLGPEAMATLSQVRCTQSCTISNIVVHTVALTPLEKLLYILMLCTLAMSD
jgi:hypothetical protein